MALLGLTTAGLAGIRVNTTPSMSAGLWRVAEAADLHRGDVAILCLQGAETVQIGRFRGYIGHGSCSNDTEPLVKPVVAVAGDRVTVAADGIAVNDSPLPNTAQLAQDTSGRPLPAWPAGTYAVLPGQVWVIASRVSNSWDSRYWGPIPVSSVIGVTHPVAVLP